VIFAISLPDRALIVAEQKGKIDLGFIFFSYTSNLLNMPSSMSHFCGAKKRSQDLFLYMFMAVVYGFRAAEITTAFNSSYFIHHQSMGPIPGSRSSL
jgi:hypothetical protein